MEAILIIIIILILILILILSVSRGWHEYCRARSVPKGKNAVGMVIAGCIICANAVGILFEHAKSMPHIR